jgi:hypothetical protein
MIKLNKLLKPLQRSSKKAGIHGSCIELQGMLTDINAVNRSKAWNEVAKETGQYTTIVQVPTNWNPELFLSGLTNALNAHPEANCVFAASDFAFPRFKRRWRKQVGGRRLDSRSTCGWQRATFSRLL